MTIDYFYSNRVELPEGSNNWKELGVPKDNFYLGMVSQVYRDSIYIQVENLSLLNHRNIRLESLAPSTINFLVAIDSIQGLFIAEVYQSRVNSSSSVHESLTRGIKENIYPEIAVNILGIFDGNKFKASGIHTAGITDKVYIANKKLITAYLGSLEVNDYKTRDDHGKVVYNQKPLEELMRLDNFDSEYLSLQPNTLFDRHLMVVGTTNSGKSTSSLTILDKLVSANKKVLIIDPTGEYEKSFTDDEVERFILGTDVSLTTADVDDQFWIDFFNVSSLEDSNKASVLSDAISSLRYQKSMGNNYALKKEDQPVNQLLSRISSVSSKEFDLSLLPDQIKMEAVKQYPDGNVYKFKRDGNLFNASIWLIQKVTFFLKSSLIENFFNDKNTNLFEKLTDFLNPAKKTSMYLNLSQVSKTDTSGRTIVDLIAKFVVEHGGSSKGKERDTVVVFIDEVHRYIDKYSEESGLISIAREGRKKGIFLFLTTQSPKDVPDILLGQVGTMIIHRLTHSEEITAIQNYLNKNIVALIPRLNQGEAILTSINLLQDIQVSFQESGRIHDNNTPLI